MSRKLGDTGSKELPQRCHFILEFSFSLNNRACQQLAKLLLLLRREEEEEEVIRWGFCSGAQALHGKDNAISILERCDRAFVLFSFPWFQYLLTIRNRDVDFEYRNAVYQYSQPFPLLQPTPFVRYQVQQRR